MIGVVADQIRVSVLGGRTQLDVALPADVAVASLVPELVTLIRSREDETPADSPWPEAKHTFWVLRTLDSDTPLQPDQTLRGAGVVDGQQLRLTEQPADSAPTLYDDVVDAAARLNKAAYPGWDTVAAQWMSFAGMGVVSVLWVCLLTLRPPRSIIVGLAAVVAVAIVGGAALAHRWYRKAQIAAALGWSAIPISTAIAWTVAARFGGYGLAAGCAVLVALFIACYRAVGTGRWGYVVSSVVFAGGAPAVLAHTLGAPARTVGVVVAVVAALACLAVPRLTGRLARAQPDPDRDPDPDALRFDNPFAPSPPASAPVGATDSSAAAMPTAEVVWARVHSATLMSSSLYAGLGVAVVCAAANVLYTGKAWAAMVFAAVCAVALATMARLPETATERLSLGVPAAALVVLGALSAQRGTVAMAWTGLATLIAVAAAASLAGLRAARGSLPQRFAPCWAYLHYAAYAALIPAAWWAAGGFAEIR